MPTRRCEQGAWLHPARLPLGAGWFGVCTAHPAREIVPSDLQVQEFCNLGYASGCPHLPADRTGDAVRFCISQHVENHIVISYVCELKHAPTAHGALEYDAGSGLWLRTHLDPRIQKMAECYVETYLAKNNSAVITPASS
jgi:hypothetical protein